jgi:hypothetical protein
MGLERDKLRAPVEEWIVAIKHDEAFALGDREAAEVTEIRRMVLRENFSASRDPPGN